MTPPQIVQSAAGAAAPPRAPASSAQRNRGGQQTGVTWLLYVPLAEVARRLAEGWEIADDFASVHHGRHAVLMRWAGDGAPPGAPDD